MCHLEVVQPNESGAITGNQDMKKLPDICQRKLPRGYCMSVILTNGELSPWLSSQAAVPSAGPDVQHSQLGYCMPAIIVRALLVFRLMSINILK